MTVHVTPTASGGWLVQQNGRHVSKHRLKRRAKKRARQEAGPSERVVVHDSGGRFNDSFNPR